MAWERKDWDIILVPVGFLILAMYHAYYIYVLRKQPLQTVIGLNHAGRRAWVQSMMKDMDKKGVLAVQSLRNSMMGSILWASVAILLCSAATAFVNVPSSTEGSSYIFGAAHNPPVLSAKVSSLLFCFMCSFFCCMQSVRFLNEISFLINTPHPGDLDLDLDVYRSLAPFLTPEYVGDLFEKASNFQAAGSRSFYLAIPMMLWILGPLPVIMGSSLMIPFLYQLDMVK